MKKEVKRTLIVNGQKVEVKTTLTITQEEIQNIFLEKEKDFFAAIGSQVQEPQESEESEEESEEESFEYTGYGSDSSEEAPRGYTPYSSTANAQSTPTRPPQETESTDYKPYAAQKGVPKSYHTQSKSGYYPYHTWRVNIPKDKSIIIK